MCHAYLRTRLGTAAIVRAFRASLRIVAVMAALTLTPERASAQTSFPTSSRELLAMQVDKLMWLLDATRPLPISGKQQADVLSRLPPDGEVTEIDAVSREKLAMLTPVLRAAKRETVYTIKVIAVRQAFIGLHGRTVLLVSDHALALLDPDELQAVVAHEIGHEYVWEDYERAVARRAARRLRDLELVCDIVATLTLQSIGRDAAPLIDGLAKLSAFNRKAIGTALNEGHYPPLDQRRAAVLALRPLQSLQAPPVAVCGGRCE